MKEDNKNLEVARKFLILCNFICLLLLILSGQNITWLISVTAIAFVILGIGLFLSESDPATVLVLVLLSTFLSGLVLGISIVFVVKN